MASWLTRFRSICRAFWWKVRRGTSAIFDINPMPRTSVPFRQQAKPAKTSGNLMPSATRWATRWAPRPSDRLQRGVEPGALDDDAAAVARRDGAVALGVDRGQGARLGRGEPEAQQVTLLRRLRPVLEGGAVVQQGVVVHQLHVARAEFHV